MEKGKYMLIYKDETVYRFKNLKKAQRYARCLCHHNYEFYIIIDTEKDEVLDKRLY